MVKAVQQFMLGTVLNTETQARSTLAAMKKAGYDGIELCNFMIEPAGLALQLVTAAAGMPVGRGGRLNWPALVREAGLQVVSLHYDLDTLEKDIPGAVRKAKAFGTRYIVITGVYNYNFGSAEAVWDLARRLNGAGKLLATQGVSLLYHNHNCELRNLDTGEKAFELLLQKTDPQWVNFEFDSCWFAEAGADPAAWMKRLGSRMKLWHINDRGSRAKGNSLTPIIPSDSMELGTGNMPLDALVAQAKELGVEAVVLESHRNWIEKSPVKSFQKSAEYLNRHI